MILPNKEIIQQPIVNHSRSPAMRIDAPVQVAYGVAVDRVREVLLDGGAARPAGARRARSRVVVVTALGESGVTVELRVWVADPLAPASSRFLLLEVAKRALEGAGIEIPFPQSRRARGRRTR